MRMAALVTRGLLLSAAVLCLVLPAPVQADRVVNANEPIVISDDITDMTQPVVSASFSNGDGNDNNRSGLGDGTNPGQGGGTDNVVNDGTDNPNESDGNP